jgi:hypothetical protein
MKSMLRIAFSAGGALLLAGLIVGAANADITGNTNTSAQSGANATTSTQASASVSGNATAIDSGVAISGTANTATVFQGAQSLGLGLFNQSAAGDADIAANVNTAVQQAANGLGNAQTNGAASGAASAEDEGSSTTGAAGSAVQNIQAQIQSLLQYNQSLPPTAP